ncbi:hypothetical protein F5Y14DRAFT_424501 [Nemania sp. NC0429]|nr:hypothetical protein F5Y14DRAFT_424501 [Nemania sp. NC0429]
MDSQPTPRVQSASLRTRLRMEDDEGWVNISRSSEAGPPPPREPSSSSSSSSSPSQETPASNPAPDSAPESESESESMQDRIVRVAEDLSEIEKFYNIEGSPTRHARLSSFLASELAALSRGAPFASYARDERADFVLLRSFLRRAQRNLALERAREAEFAPFVAPFAEPIRAWCELRQRQRPDEVFDPQALGASLSATRDAVARCLAHVVAHGGKYSQATGSRAARRIGELRKHLGETCDFYSGYDPSFDYWVASPRHTLDTALGDLETAVRDVIVGGSNNNNNDNNSNDDDDIVGEPIGRDGLLVELEAEMIPYSPEELLRIAEREYAWCEKEMKKAAAELGFADWRAALEHVKNLYASPAEHASFVRGLVSEGAAYVRRHDLVTVPRLAEEAITLTRIPPARQRVSPFFLGGRRLQVACPREDMAHASKAMTLRGNNRHFSRATAFHEMIPGHRLQVFVGARSRPYRARLFSTPFFVEGWALYWEMVLWDRGDFFVSPEDRIGSLFWRMHRCVRITFSLGFHLGRLSARRCVELLVQRVGHERSTAEGEVRRSLNGSYPPLYQAGYMLGALQLMQLRREAVEAAGAGFAEKEFHDAVLRANTMPIEMLRALLLGKELRQDFKSTWRFYGDV